MTDNRNTILAVILSGIVLIAWQFFYNVPQMEKQRVEAQKQAELAKPTQPATPGSPAPQAGTAPPNAPAVAPAPTAVVSRATAIAATPRIKIDSPKITGSISLKGARIDDVALTQYRETVDPKSPAIVLFSPSGTAEPFYAEFLWVPAAGSTVRIPNGDTVWQQEGTNSLTPTTPVALKYDNGAGLVFKRTIAIDDRYLFTIKDEVSNIGSDPVTLHPYGLVSRGGTPQVAGYYILHEGFIGYLGDKRLQEESYKSIDDSKTVIDSSGAKGIAFSNITNAWLGITDKYWAAALLPETTATLQNARFSTGGAQKRYQADYMLGGQTISIGGTATSNARLFAGAKEAGVVGINFPLVGLGGYNKQLDLNHFDLLIDWGWFYFITKPMFLALDWFFHMFGNFGVAILMVTVLVKLLFFPLANKSYASMAKMKSVQPQLQALKERFPDDKAKQQQEMMEIYKKEKINPIAGCLPIALQIPVFFSLYKVLFVTIEMRHAPFYGWIKDLSAHDPTTIFNLFGLIPWDPMVLGPVIGPYLMLGVWPIIMGITMWIQMKLNPAPPDPTQKMIFDWMPLIFTFMLASFPAGLVIYWAWNNLLSVIQQSYIMRKNGVKVELFDNLKSTFAKKPAEAKAESKT